MGDRAIILTLAARQLRSKATGSDRKTYSKNEREVVDHFIWGKFGFKTWFSGNMVFSCSEQSIRVLLVTLVIRIPDGWILLLFKSVYKFLHARVNLTYLGCKASYFQLGVKGFIKHPS